MTIYSKPIRKADDSAKALIIDALEGKDTGGFDIDSIYCRDGRYYILEFLKCDTVTPFDSHPKRYWFRNKMKFISLWKITRKLEGVLYLINYEDSREQFKIIKVKELDENGIQDEKIKKWDYKRFKRWFQLLNKID